LFLAFPVLAALVFLVRRLLLEPFHLVEPEMHLFEVIVWAIVVSATVAAGAARTLGAQTFGPVTFGLAMAMTVIALVRTHVLHELGLVPAHVTLSEVLAWTLALGGAAATALAPATQARLQRTVERIAVPAGARVVACAAGWVVAVTFLCWFGTVTNHLKSALIIVGVINGIGIALAILPFAEGPLQKGLTTFLAGVTVDNIGGAENTAAARAIETVAGSIQQIAGSIAAQFNASLPGLELPLHASLWATLGVIIAALVFSMVGLAGSNAPRRDLAPAAQPALV
jgi:hypothetical protein